ncbi:pyridoxal-phosphate dependent enzyme [Halolamina sp. CBA1230]|uniref:threonine synthase n=1 Tax=Halolamina sp. CBA1230 TaxID=1853690 RepID=UPI00117A05D3|nr:pyridoxal-phosphate dependent enzyme [Halolamina sp. CBA1230]QKY21002.1 pyridoxal-phosphate dependent enzyme [Halolamina sp. CBA1230]
MTRVCWQCGSRTDDDRRVRCGCGEPLWLDTAPGAVPDSWPDRVESMWDVLPLLGVEQPEPSAGLSTAAGGTPLLRTPSLDTDGVAVHVKHEGVNPTGSFKDRGTAFGVAAAAARGESRIGTVSHGNMAESVAAYAAAAGMGCTVLVPADIADERLAAIARYDPRLVRVDGDYGRLYHEALEVGREAGVRFLNSDAPWRVAGQATTALEVLAQFARTDEIADASGAGRRSPAPDVLILPVSSGGHASGAWQAVRALTAAGLLDAAPTLCFVQAAACAPIAEAFERGDDEVTAVDGGETVAYSIANADPPSGNRALAAARATGGAVVAVDDDAIERAGERFAGAGLAVEPASATTLAALSPLRENGTLAAGDTVALVATGRGFGGADASVTADCVDLSALGSLFG